MFLQNIELLFLYPWFQKSNNPDGKREKMFNKCVMKSLNIEDLSAHEKNITFYFLVFIRKLDIFV